MVRALNFANSNSETIHLMQTVKTIRREMSTINQSFCGVFTSNSEIDSVPQSLLSLLTMILGMPENSTCNSALSIAQLIYFNFVNKSKSISTTSTKVRHNANKETPLPIYVGLLLHSQTRSRDLIEKFHQLGLSISYDRVLEISTALGDNVCNQFEEDKIVKIVCPQILRKEVFTTAAVDNIDHNPSSRTAKDSFHGTAISITQHLVDNSDGVKRQFPVIETTSNCSILKKLPTSFSSIELFVLPSKDFYVPKAAYVKVIIYFLPARRTKVTAL